MAGVRENALLLLRLINDKTKGSINSISGIEDIIEGEDLGKEDARNASDYLAQKGLIKDWGIVGPLPMVSMTAAGIDSLEDALQHPNAPTRYFPPASRVYNQIYVMGDVNGSSLQAGSTASPVTVSSQSGIDLKALADQLQALRVALLAAAKAPEEYVAVGQIAEAEVAAKEGDQGRAIAALKKLGHAAKWALDTGKGIAIPVAAAAIKSALGIP